ncbi:putative quinol monooxygenase [Streptomyces monticola]|uniref:Quinol monooxygenase n=1 Tax=Streptomyces monticola TaxID=2666263 RepID=A0ABW2JET0_9ACTN
MSYVVIATMIAKPGQEDLVEKTLREAAAEVHAEPGCARWALHRRTGSAGHFVMVEKWESKEALAAHGKAPALAGIGRVLKDALEGPADVVVYDALPAGDAGKGAL